MRYTINLATRTYVNRKQLNLFLGGAGALLVLVLLYLGNSAFVTILESNRLQKELRPFDAKSRDAAGVSEQEYGKLLSDIAFANSLIDKKTFNWLALMDRLEGVVPDGVAISAIEPDLKTGGLKLSGVTRKFANLRSFMEQLESKGFFRDVYLLTLIETKVGETQTGLTFTISCKVDYRAL
ncbi:MAG: PilN domain-containing protein [Geobacter sp.]|nr:PilN domain-containing protein [Geobacter sp.]